MYPDGNGKLLFKCDHCSMVQVVSMQSESVGCSCQSGEPGIIKWSLGATVQKNDVVTSPWVNPPIAREIDRKLEEYYNKACRLEAVPDIYVEGSVQRYDMVGLAYAMFRTDPKVREHVKYFSEGREERYDTVAQKTWDRDDKGWKTEYLARAEEVQNEYRRRG